MRVGIIGASGKQGSLILAEAIKRGMDVTAIVRNRDKIRLSVPIIEKDLFDLTIYDLEHFDVVVDAFNAVPGEEALHQTSMAHLIELLTNSNIRLMVVGGAGSLYTSEDKKMTLSETPDFPPSFQATADNMRAALQQLRNSEGLIWTYISPAAFFNPNGVKTGKYQISGDVMKLNSAGESEISYADYAIAFVDEMENRAYLNQRMSVVSQ